MIGVVYAQQRDWDNASRYFLKSLEIDADDRHDDGVARSLNDIAKMCSDRGLIQARAALVQLGNAVIAHFAGRTGLDVQSVDQCCRDLPPELGPGVAAAVKHLLR